MIDRLGRNITYLRISVTELCNLRCRYCMPAEGVCKKSHADMLTEDEMIQAVEAAAIACGSNMVRVGTAIFGARDYGPINSNNSGGSDGTL